jgi:hypothetical protein
MTDTVRILVRETFDAAVKDGGGEVIRALLPETGTLAKNADYLFRAEQVSAEKCLVPGRQRLRRVHRG